MLLSLALIILVGFALQGAFQKLHLPGLLGVLLAGILLGPHVLNQMAPVILTIAPDLKKIALIIVLVRAGLSLDLKDLKKVGRPALLMSFLPATLEITGVALLAPRLLGISLLEAALLGAVLCAVSPAVVVPNMLRLMESGYGMKHRVPQLIMAGASADNIYAVVLFTLFMGFAATRQFSPAAFLSIPVSVLTGLAAGFGSGASLVFLFRRFHMRDTVKVLLLLGLAFLLVGLQDIISTVVPFSGLLAVRTLGMTILRFHAEVAHRCPTNFPNLGWRRTDLICAGRSRSGYPLHRWCGRDSDRADSDRSDLSFLGTLLCVCGTELTRKERLFCVIAYLPKATVQAAIGALPLAAGLPSGKIILTAAILSILIAAPSVQSASNRPDIGCWSADRFRQRSGRCRWQSQTLFQPAALPGYSAECAWH
jgi:NhaP-type Na+/H+ or K+/H+ antiporter